MVTEPPKCEQCDGTGIYPDPTSYPSVASEDWWSASALCPECNGTGVPHGTYDYDP